MNINKEILSKIEYEYGESFYLLNSSQFKKNYMDLLSAFRKIYQNTNIAYSYKTNYTPKLCKIVDELGGYAEVVSDMEYEIAKRIGVDPARIIFNGPYKNMAAVEEILIKGGTVNIDSICEWLNIVKIANNHPQITLNVGIRCNFGISEGVLSRFGFDVNSEEFHKVLSDIGKEHNIHLIGLHCHFATRKLETWERRANGMLSLYDDLCFSGELVDQLEHFDLGGGLFGKMGELLKAQFDTYIPSYDDYALATATQFVNHFTDANKPILFIEPGSALVGDSMKFASKVTNIKNVRGKSIATLLGSIYNINPTLNTKNPPITIYHMGTHKADEYSNLDFGGFTCIESDYMYRGFTGKLAVGDYVVFDNVGSYSLVLKPPFILPNFAVLDISENEGAEIELIKQHETFDDIFHTFVF